VSTDANILAAARSTIERHGWHDTTLERIAGEAGLSRMTLHRRGVTRAAVLAALSAGLEAEYQAAMWPALTAPGSARTRLEQALDALCDLCDRNLELFAALGEAERWGIFHERAAGDDAASPPADAPAARDAASPPADAPAARDAASPPAPGVLTRDAFTGAIERLLRDGAADGSIRTVADPAETATVLFNLVSHTYRHLRRGHGWPPERARQGVLTLALDGIGGEASPGGLVSLGVFAQGAKLPRGEQ
jgi:AcrR family transcriptional regulator